MTPLQYSWVLFGSKYRIILVVSSLQISKDEILDVISKSILQKGAMSLSVVLHCWLKKVIEQICFYQKVSDKFVIHVVVLVNLFQSNQF